MPRSAMFAIDLLAISVMVFGLYFPRHRRKDLVVAYLGVNVGVLAVADALNATDIGAGLGLGLLGGLTVGPDWLTPTLMGAIIAVLFIGDHPRLFAGYRTQVVNLDSAFTDETALRNHLERLLDARIHRLKIRKVDMVNDTTSVEVRYRLAPGMPAASAADSRSYAR